MERTKRKGHAMKTLSTSLLALFLTAAPAAFAAPPSGVGVVRASPVSAPAARPAAQISPRPQPVARVVSTKATLSPAQLERRLGQLERQLAAVGRSKSRNRLEQRRELEREIARVERDLRVAKRTARLQPAPAQRPSRRG